jgi:methionine sulfoxide reductase heme-binding subunit
VSSPLLWYVTRSTGLVALLLFTATVVLGLLTAGRASGENWPRFVQQDLHRRISILAAVFLAIHVLTSVLDSYVHIGWLAVVIPFTSPYERFFIGLGAVSVDFTAAVMISSFLRSRMRPRTWRAIHWIAYLSWPVAIAHSIGAGTDARLLWVDGLVAACCLCVVVAGIWRFGGAPFERRESAPQGTQARAVMQKRTG